MDLLPHVMIEQSSALADLPGRRVGAVQCLICELLQANKVLRLGGQGGLLSSEMFGSD
jgi:hypothetical protein